VNRFLVVVLMAGSCTLCGPIAQAQTTSSQQGTDHVISDQDLSLLRKDLRSKRKQLIAANLKLTDTEAAKFWPIYDQYTQELVAINDKKFGLIQDYADNWGKMTNDQSLLFSRQTFKSRSSGRSMCRSFPKRLTARKQQRSSSSIAASR